MNDAQIDRLAQWLKESFAAPNQLIGTPDRSQVARRMVGDNPDRHKSFQDMLRYVDHPDHLVGLGDYMAQPRRRKWTGGHVQPVMEETEVEDFARRSLNTFIDRSANRLKSENCAERRREAVKGALAYLGIK